MPSYNHFDLSQNLNILNTIHNNDLLANNLLNITPASYTNKDINMDVEDTIQINKKRKRHDINKHKNYNEYNEYNKYNSRTKSSHFGTEQCEESQGVTTRQSKRRKTQSYKNPDENKIIFLVSNTPSTSNFNSINNTGDIPCIWTKDSSKSPTIPPPDKVDNTNKNKSDKTDLNNLDDLDDLELFNKFMDELLNELLKDLTNLVDEESNGPKTTAPAKKQKNTTPKIIDLDCNNPLCNHKSFDEDPTPPTLLNIVEIKSLNDLITLGKAFHCKKQKIYKDLNLRLMNNLVAPLTELNDMIGMKDVKEHVVDQILFFLQGFNTNNKCNTCQDCVHGLPCIQSNTEMLHTIITGPPGVGKTCLGRIMGKVYKSMGILSNGTFHEVTRTDFVAGYLGQTAIKTQKLIDKCKGGVMFIDEAYSMGSEDKRDSFSKEALDTLNKNLSDNRDMLCIIAGYEKDLDKCFFAANDGLKRRFTFKHDVKEYDYRELADIFKLKVEKEGWCIDYNSDNNESNISVDSEVIRTDEDLINLFRTHKHSFPYSGGDIETYFLQCKIVHGRRIPTKRKHLSYNDLQKGFAQFTKNRKETKSKKNDDEDIRPNMYNLN